MINKSFAINFISSITIGFLLSLLDTLSFGRSLLSEDRNPMLNKLSLSLFSYSFVTAQIAFNVFSSLPTGIVAGPIVEIFPLARTIYNGFSESKSPFTNFFILMAISTFLLAIISLLIKRFNLSRLLCFIPEQAIAAVLLNIGLSQVIVGYNQLSGLQIPIGICISLILFVLEETISLPYIIPFSAVAVVIIFYLVAFIAGWNFKVLRENEWLLEYDPTILLPTHFIKELDFKNIDFKLIAASSPKILSVVGLSIIQLFINLPTFYSSTRIPFNFDKELQAQGFSNLLTSFFGSPSYFTASYSVFFSRSGGSKSSGVFLGFLIILIALYGPIMTGYVPVILLGGLPLLVGWFFIYPSIIKSFRAATYFEYSIIIIAFTISYFGNEPLYSIIFGCVLSLLPILYFKSTQRYTPPPISHIISFTGPLLFYNITSISAKAKEHEGSYLIIDLMNCGYIDWTSRIYLEELMKSKRLELIIVGRPLGFKNYNFLEDAIKVSDYQEMLCVVEELSLKF